MARLPASRSWVVHLTIRAKVLLLCGLGTALVLCLGVVLWHTQGMARDVVANLAVANTMLRNQMEGDMRHDAIHSDVLGALVAKTSTDLEAAVGELEVHGREFLEHIHANARLEVPEALHAETESLLPRIETYVAAGRAIVTQARADRDGAQAGYGAFQQAFDTMEEVMANASDHIQAYAGGLETAAAIRLGSAGSWGTAIAALAILVMIGGGWLVGRSILGPLHSLRARVDSLGGGACDLRQRLDASRRDELGQLAAGVNTFLARMQSMIAELGRNAGALLTASRSLVSTSTDLAAGADQTRRQSSEVAAAAEEMSVTLQQVSNSGQQTSERIGTVVATVEQIVGNVAEVARSAEDASVVSGQAATLASSSNALIGELGAAAEEIGRVIDTIQDIADQTNLLALNATIEAARAGEAGRGFAVVANEVKALASQTSGATTDIRQRIERIQGGTAQTVGRMVEIAGVIARVSEASQSIAHQVGAQRGSMQSITQNVADVARMMTMVSTGVRESAKVSTEISRSIGAVDATAQQSGRGASTTRTAGQELEAMAGNLQGLLGQFQV